MEVSISQVGAGGEGGVVGWGKKLSPAYLGFLGSFLVFLHFKSHGHFEGLWFLVDISSAWSRLVINRINLLIDTINRLIHCIYL